MGLLTKLGIGTGTDDSDEVTHECRICGEQFDGPRTACPNCSGNVEAI